ncbi:MAG TPA: GYD domain-containing protein [Methylovirgula sp.]|nr:GYD domain-containing protein [Methylovirgula sp.]
MPKFLGLGSYTAEAWQGIKNETASHRREFVAHLLTSVGGRLEAFYFAFGEHDFVFIADFPDNVTAAGVAISVAASGTIKSHMTPLLTPEEIDVALKKEVHFRPPGAR